MGALGGGGDGGCAGGVLIWPPTRGDRRAGALLLRDQLLKDRLAIEALPQPIKDFIFSDKGTSPLRPEEYATVVRIADKLSKLTPAELAEYKSRTTARTADLTLFEGSIDRFRAEREARAQVTEEREKVSTKLAALEDVYRDYRAYLSSLKTGALLGALGTPQAAGAALGGIPAQNKQRQELTDKLARHGFSSIAAFEATIHQYEAGFQKESAALANVMLDQYAHTLFEQEARYDKGGAAAGLYKQLGPARKAHRAAHVG